MRLPQAVLFDLDGTLIESEHLWLKAEQITMSTWGVDWLPGDQEACLGGPFERVVAYMRDRVFEYDDSADVTSRAISDTLISNIVHLFSTTDIEWRPGAREIVHETHRLGIPTAIVTASWRVLLDTVVTNMSRQVGQFTVTVAGDEVPHSKPNPFPYLEASRRLEVDILSCLAIEDSPTGAASAIAAGARTIAVEHIAPINLPGTVVIDTLDGRDLEELWSLVYNV